LTILIQTLKYHREQRCRQAIQELDSTAEELDRSLDRLAIIALDRLQDASIILRH